MYIKHIAILLNTCTADRINQNSIPNIYIMVLIQTNPLSCLNELYIVKPV